MSAWYYYDRNGEKQGPVTGGELKGLAKTGMIMPNTVVETENGETVPASKVKGLTFVEAAQQQMPLPAESKPLSVAPAKQAAPQSIPAPVAEGGKSSLLITFIGVVAVLVVGGIGWTMINTASPPVKQVPIAEAKQEQQQEQEQEKQEQIAVEQKEREEQEPFTAEEQAEIDKSYSSFTKGYLKWTAEKATSSLLVAIGKDTSPAVAKYLISQGADIHAQNFRGTPLHWAAYYGNLEVARLLISSGADVNAKNKDGETALRLAVKETLLGLATKKMPIEIVQLLASKGTGANDFYSEEIIAKQIDVLVNERNNSSLKAHAEYLAKHAEDNKSRARFGLPALAPASAKPPFTLSPSEKQAVATYMTLLQKTMGEKYSQVDLDIILGRLDSKSRDKRVPIDVYVVNKAHISFYESERDKWIINAGNDATRWSIVNKAKANITLLEIMLPESNRLSNNAHNAEEQRRLSTTQRNQQIEQDRIKREEEKKALFQ